MEEEENEKFEALLNASTGLGHVNDKDEYFDNEEHCEKLGRVSINSDEREIQNKKQPLYSTRSKTSH